MALGAPYSACLSVRYSHAGIYLYRLITARLRRFEGVPETRFWGAFRAQPLGAITHTRGRTMHAHT